MVTSGSGQNQSLGCPFAYHAAMTGLARIMIAALAAPLFVLSACSSDSANTSDSAGASDSPDTTSCPQPPVFDGQDPPGDFKGQDYTECDFAGADLTKADFDSANLSGVNFQGANLTEAIFNQANISGADFTGATMKTAYLTGTNVENANFTDANMGGATIVSLQGAESATWVGTKCPGKKDGPDGPCKPTRSVP